MQPAAHAVSKAGEPLVSIALAVYNGAEFLGMQLDSLRAQTYTRFEVVITDDGSTDGTQEILSRYAAQDSRIRWTVNRQKRGMVSNFSEAVSLCKGEILFLCDCDDVWYPEKLQKHVDEYQDESVQWVYNEALVTDEDGNPLGLLTDIIAPDYYTRMTLRRHAGGGCVIGCATSYRSSCMRKLWPAPAYAHGHDSWIQLAIFPARAKHIPIVLQDYRQHSRNTVGLKDNPGEVSRIHTQNMLYLKSLAHDARLAGWKRFYVLAMLWGKKLRAAYRGY